MTTAEGIDGRFRRLWAAQAVSQLGDRITELALPLIAVDLLAADADQVGLLNAAVWLPYLGSVLAGGWVDRQRHKRRVMVAADLARMIVLLSLPIGYWLDLLSLAQLFAVALLNGLGEVFFNTAVPTVFVSLVPRSAYLRANSRLSGTRALSYIVGPALGGPLIQVLTAPVAVLVDAVSFAGSAILLARLRLTGIPAEKTMDDESETPWWRSLSAGARFIAGDRTLRACLACATTVNLFGLIASTLIVLYARRTLDLSPGLIGLAFGIGAVGGLLGAALTPRLARRIGIGRTAMVGSVLFPIAYAVPVFASGVTPVKVIVLGSAEFLGAIGVMLFDVSLNSLQTSLIPDHLRSRVAGAFSTVNYGVRPVGAVAGGLLGTAFGLRPTLLVAAIGGVLSVFWLFFSPVRLIREL